MEDKMKNIFKIFIRDLNSIIRNWVALVIILGLMILPSLYAWFNIRASWDPYGNTVGIKVAIVNKDKGGNLQEKYINIGNELVGKLKDNTNLGWQFVSEEEGNKGVETGKYYATIIIPEEFSNETLSIIDKDINRPTLIYKVNEKSNAIAPKITDKGVTTIKSQIDANIIQTVDGLIFMVLNEAGVSIEGAKDKILKIIDGVIELNNKIPDIEKVINELQTGGSHAESLVSKAKENLPLLKDTLTSSNSLLVDTKKALENSTVALGKIEPVVKSDLELINRELNNLEGIINTLININIDKDGILNGLDNISIKLGEINTKINGVIKSLEPLSKFNATLKELLNDLSLASSKLNSVMEIISKISDGVNNAQPIDKSKLQEINALIANNRNIILNILNNYDSKYIPAINNAINELTKISDNSIKLLDEAKSAIPDIEGLLDTLNNALNLGKGDIEKLNTEMPIIKDRLSNITSKLVPLSNEDEIDKLLSLLKNDWQSISKFLGSPVDIKEETLFHIPNYGSAMSPFYSTLALWVGALILVSLLTTEPHGFESDIEFKSYEKYFGKYLTFGFIGICQTLILTLGDIYLLKCYVLNKGLFIFISLLSSLIFILIVYTLVSIFGNVGKAIGVILLVIQVAGAGGTFPVEVMPKFFKMVNPLLPFTYSISAMRESVAGVVKENLARDLIILLIYGVIFIIIGILLKGPINKISKKFIDKLNQSGLIGH